LKQRVVLATRSAGKLRELQPLLQESGLEPVTLAELGVPLDPGEEDIERFDSFRENALAKAHYFYARCGGLPVVADDSGLEVAALGGRPGVHSKRWSGRTDLSGAALDAANNAQLMAALRSVSNRSARYVCEAAWVDATTERVARGECDGSVIELPRGAAGFGYDPHFLSNELGLTFGEASLTERARVSHRGRALRRLLSSTVDVVP
jgi:XTP/dITP diphosphohydrolase